MANEPKERDWRLVAIALLWPTQALDVEENVAEVLRKQREALKATTNERMAKLRKAAAKAVIEELKGGGQ